MRARLIDQHAFDVRPQQVAQDPQVQGQIGVHQLPRLGAQPLLAHELPQLAQIHHIGPQRVALRVLRRRAHDVSGAFIGLQSGQHRAAQTLALRLILDSRRHADAAPLGHVDQVA